MDVQRAIVDRFADHGEQQFRAAWQWLEEGKTRHTRLLAKSYYGDRHVESRNKLGEVDALRHAVQSRELAEALLSRLELRGQGPTRLREFLPYSLLGVDAPGLMLECATLTAPEDRDRVMAPDGLAALAATLADGIEAYQRNE